MKYSILLMLLMSSYIMAQEKTAKLYYKTGYVAKGEIIEIRRYFVKFKEIFDDGTSKTTSFRKRDIYLLTDSEGEVRISNPSLKRVFESMKNRNFTEIRKNDFNSNINPDGIVGSLFIDLGVGSTLSEEGQAASNSELEGNFIQSETASTQDFSIAFGLPVSEYITIFGGYQRFSSSQTFDNTELSSSVNYVHVKLRIYLF